MSTTRMSVPRAVLLVNTILGTTGATMDIPRLQAMIRDGTLPGSQDERGRWWTTEAAVRQWAADLKETRVQQ
ncbi:MAG: hypothetical protein KKB13_16970 [Chloroflexi bacterium]|nr:hypothetical protein [Chloroflexota bacterium]